MFSFSTLSITVTVSTKKPSAEEHLPSKKRKEKKTNRQVVLQPQSFFQAISLWPGAQALIPDHKAISLRGENILHATVNQRAGRIMYLCLAPPDNHQLFTHRHSRTWNKHTHTHNVQSHTCSSCAGGSIPRIRYGIFTQRGAETNIGLPYSYILSGKSIHFSTSSL